MVRPDPVLVGPTVVKTSLSPSLHTVTGDVASRMLQVQHTLRQQRALPVGGRLSKFWQQWREIGAPKSVVRWLRNGYALPFKRCQGKPVHVKLQAVCPDGLSTSYACNSEKSIALNVMVSQLLAKKAIARVPAGQHGFYNRVFLRPKKTGGWRLILDVSRLNQYLFLQTFKMDHIQVVREGAQQGMWATSIDFSDAYHHIPIKRAHYMYLCFVVAGIAYWYISLPFGLNTAPQVFTTVVRPVKLWARRQLFRLFQYLDDWLNLATSYDLALEQTLRFVEKCVDLGLLVNLKKSELVPVQVIQFLGFQLDFTRAMVFPTQERMQAVQKTIRSLLTARTPTTARAESLRGKLTALEKAVPYGRLNYRHFQRCVTIALHRGRHPSQTLTLTAAARQDLRWWLTPANVTPGTPFVRPTHTVEVQTDASSHGWGAHVQQQVLRGQWSHREQHMHINVLEMRAVVRTIQSLRNLLRGKTVLFLIDNVTVVSHIMKQGGTRSLLLMRETRELFALTQELQMTPLAHHIAGALNVVADLASRHGQVINTEWQLSTELFQWVCSRSPWGTPEVDLFANRCNHRLPAYISPCPDSDAIAVDALVCPWPCKVLYAFPPQVLMPKVLTKLRQEHDRRVLLVAPLYQAAPWFPTLQAWSTRPPQLLPWSAYMLRQPHWLYFHPQPELLHLHLWCLKTPSWSGKVTRHKWCNA